MTKRTFSNSPTDPTTTLAAQLTTGATTITLAADPGTEMPTTGPFTVLIGDSPDTEPANCASRSGTTVTLVSAWAGSTFPAGTNVNTGLAKVDLDALMQQDDVDLSIAAIDFPVDSVAGRTGAVTLTKSDVGLGNVDNTSDANKPVSTAQQTALDAKLDIDGSDPMTGALKTPSVEPADGSYMTVGTAGAYLEVMDDSLALYGSASSLTLGDGSDFAGNVRTSGAFLARPRFKSVPLTGGKKLTLTKDDFGITVIGSGPTSGGIVELVNMPLSYEDGDYLLVNATYYPLTVQPGASNAISGFAGTGNITLAAKSAIRVSLYPTTYTWYQTALDKLPTDTTLDGDPLDLTSPANDDLLQRKSGTWVNRTVAQLITDLEAGGVRTAGVFDGGSASTTYGGAATIDGGSASG